MRALILIAGASLALAACGDRADRDQNVIVLDNGADVEVVPNDGNWQTVNTDEFNQQAGHDAQPCPEGRRCDTAPVGPPVT